MPDKKPLNVVLFWHMHQPEYRDLHSNNYQLPWTYLHAIKDYTDMAAHIEACPKARAVINFAPILLDQLSDYINQLEQYFSSGGAIRDPLLAALVQPALPGDDEVRLALLRSCLRVNPQRVIHRFPAFQKLADLAQWLQKHPESMVYVEDQLLVDMLVWYHLGWLGESVREVDTRVQKLQKKERCFTLQDRRELLQVILECLQSLPQRYRKLATAGQVELAMSPYAHPIVPLLLSIHSAQEAMPEAPLPEASEYPGGENRAHWHIGKGLESFERFFGMRPAGCWPSEGGVSLDTLKLLEQHGFRWAASGESVLHNSLVRSASDKKFNLPAAQQRHCLYRFDGVDVDCLFRDDRLSDLIGFNYADWHADDAVSNLLHHLQEIHSASKHPEEHVVSIILDGENAWEYYPENGRYFLGTIYKRIAEHPLLNLTTYGELQQASLPRVHIPKMVAGSWVYGTFSTWIGSADKNRGWDLLIDAKRCYDEVVAAGVLSDEMLKRAELQLAVCEGSDWFWWLGDYNPAATVSDFERLFRLHLSYFYQLLGRDVPTALTKVISRGSGSPAMGGVMLHGQPTGGVQ